MDIYTHRCSFSWNFFFYNITYYSTYFLCLVFFFLYNYLSLSFSGYTPIGPGDGESAPGEGNYAAVVNTANFGMRYNSINFQSYHVKSCSDWLSYFSYLSEVWSFFLIFYFLALFFFIYYIFPESSKLYRVSTNFSTPQSWLSSFFSCGVPFILIFSVLYESIYLLYINEVSIAKMTPLFLIEGKQWKWEYRYNLVGLLEHTFFKKVVGTYTEVSSHKYYSSELKYINSKYQQLAGSDFCDGSLRVKSELLKSKKTFSNTGDLLRSRALLTFGDRLLRKELSFSFPDLFSKFRVTECTRRMVTANKSLFLPDLTLVKANVTGCDVIHSWTLPGLGVRIDAVPGKIYSIKLPFRYYGVFVGQCSEVCGLRHAYMPISVVFLPYESFTLTLYTQFFYFFDFMFNSYNYKL